MIEEINFWNVLSDEVREYLSMKYYQKTRCCLEASEIASISRREVQETKIN